MFELFWTFGWLANGAPHIKTVQDGEPMQIEECRTAVLTQTHRMHDWLRGNLRAPLSFPVAVHGECRPIKQDATQRKD